MRGRLGSGPSAAASGRGLLAVGAGVALEEAMGTDHGSIKDSPPSGHHHRKKNHMASHATNHFHLQFSKSRATTDTADTEEDEALLSGIPNVGMEGDEQMVEDLGEKEVQRARQYMIASWQAKVDEQAGVLPQCG